MTAPTVDTNCQVDGTYTAADISDALGLSYAAVVYWTEKLNLGARSRGRAPRRFFSLADIETLELTLKDRQR